VYSFVKLADLILKVIGGYWVICPVRACTPNDWHWLVQGRHTYNSVLRGLVALSILLIRHLLCCLSLWTMFVVMHNNHWQHNEINIGSSLIMTLWSRVNIWHRRSLYCIPERRTRHETPLELHGTESWRASMDLLAGEIKIIF
jgi:hypothetical protein